MWGRYVLTSLVSFSELICNAKLISEANIVTPVSHNRLWNCLDGYPSRDYIVSGFKFGFHTGVPHMNFVRANDVTSVKRARNRSIVIEKLNAELGHGRILGPYAVSPLPFACYSPLYAIPKSTPGKFRLIHDLSKPCGYSVNDSIPEELKSVTYCNVMQVAESLVSRQNDDRKTFMAKIDLADAYRCCPIHKDDWRYLGMQFEDKLLIDICLPMGLSTSCAIFQSISNSLAWWFRRAFADCEMFNYIDDFLILAPNKERCQQALDGFLATLDYLGFPVSPQKTVLPCTHIEFLGLGIDSDSLSYFVPLSKREKYLREIDNLLSKKSHRVHTIQKLVGKLTFLCTTFLPGKALLAGLYGSLSGILSSHKWAQRRINGDVRADMKVWQSFLNQSAGKPFRFIFSDSSDVTHSIITDASGSVGYGCVFDDMWFSGTWQDDWWKGQNIALLELIPIYIALHLWIDKISDTVLSIQTDNEALVTMVNTFFSKEKLINALLKDLALLCMNNNVVLRTRHIAGCLNVVADNLSRGVKCDDHFYEVHTECNIPRALTPAHIKSQILLHN